MAFANVNTLKILMIQANCNRDNRLNGQLGNRLVRQTEKERETERDKRFIIVVVVFKFISSLRFLCGFDPPQASSAQRFLVCLSHRMPFPLHSTACFCKSPFSPINSRLPFPLNLIAKKRLIRSQNKTGDFSSVTAPATTAKVQLHRLAFRSAIACL